MLTGLFRRAALAAAVTATTVVTPAVAQEIGTFFWQMQPYCNVVTLTLTRTPAGYAVAGLDDQCGANERASVVGMASFTNRGDVAVNFTIVLAPSGQPLHVSTAVSTTTGFGTWSDSAGNRGTFAYFANDQGLPPRPMALSGLGPDVITTYEIAPGAVGGSDINTGEVQARVAGRCATGSAVVGVNADGSVACAPVQGLVTGACPAGQAVTGLNADGSLVCQALDPAIVRFRARGAVAMDVGAGSGAPVRWTDIIQDVGGGGFDTTTGTYTVPVSGTYLVTGSAVFETSSAVNGYYCLLVAVSGGLDTQSVCQPQSGGGLQLPNASAVLALTAGQTVTLVALNGSSGTQRVTGTPQTSDFSVTKLP